MEIRNDQIRYDNMMCMKHRIFLKNERLTCKEPDTACTFRAACPIWFMTKKLKNM